MAKAVGDVTSTTGTASEDRLDTDDAGPTVGQAFAALACVGLSATAVALAVVAVHMTGLATLDRATALVVLATGLTVAPMAALHVYLRRRRGLTLRSLGFVRPDRRLWHLLWQTPLAIACATAVQGVTVTLAGGGSTEGGRAGQETLDELLLDSTPALVVGVASVVVLVPLWEEVLHRGAILTALARRLGVGRAVVVSAAVFALTHLSPLLMPYVFMLGLFLGWVRWFHRTAWASVALHMANNALVTVVVLSAR